MGESQVGRARQCPLSLLTICSSNSLSPHIVSSQLSTDGCCRSAALCLGCVCIHASHPLPSISPDVFKSHFHMEFAMQKCCPFSPGLPWRGVGDGTGNEWGRSCAGCPRGTARTLPSSISCETRTTYASAAPVLEMLKNKK